MRMRRTDDSRPIPVPALAMLPRSASPPARRSLAPRPRAPSLPSAAFLLAVALLISACASRSTTTAPAAHEASVKPGINDPYKRPNVDEWVQKFEGESREIFRERHKIVAALGLRPGMAVADVGAGTGLFEPLLANAVGGAPRPTAGGNGRAPDAAIGRVYAVDIVPEFVALIRTRAAERGLTNIEPRLCREDSVELPPASVDLVFLCDVYHHFEYPRSTLASIHRALRPGGQVVIVDFKRIEGASRPWVLDHVRAGLDVVTRELEAAGFSFAGETTIDGLEENYFARFSKRP